MYLDALGGDGRFSITHWILLAVSFGIAMSEQQQVKVALGEAGILGGIRRAYVSAADRVAEGIRGGWPRCDLGWHLARVSRYLRDRLDYRVFACGKYALATGGDGSVSQDLLHAELTERDVATMPHLVPDLVGTAELNGSPGWAWQGLRWLLASCAYGKIEQLPLASEESYQTAGRRPTQP